MIVRSLGSLAFWRTRSKVVSPIYTKRRLTSSKVTAVRDFSPSLLGKDTFMSKSYLTMYLSNPHPQLYLCSPFIAWGVMMIAINASGHDKLGEIGNPIALFNIVNTVCMKYYRSFALTMVCSIVDLSVLAWCLIVDLSVLACPVSVK